jgi:hypothetical protein
MVVGCFFPRANTQNTHTHIGRKEHNRLFVSRPSKPTHVPDAAAEVIRPSEQKAAAKTFVDVDGD